MEKDLNSSAYRSLRPELLEWSYGTCQRTDGSFYGHPGATCHKGVEASPLEGAKTYGPKSKSSFANLQKTLDGLPKDQREQWSSVMSHNLGGGGVNDPPKPMHYTGKNKGKPYTDEELDAQFSKRANAWDGMIKAGYPGGLKDRVGNITPPPEGMIPRVTMDGQKTWLHPETGRVFSNASNLTKQERTDNVWRQNRVSKEDSARRAADMVQFREDQRAGKNGGKWPTQTNVGSDGVKKTVTDSDVNKLYNSLSKADQKRLVGNGLDASGGPGMIMNKYYKENPDLAVARAKDVCRRYLEQDGRSGVSGKPVALPGLEPKAGQERSSVDHFKPISGAAGQNTGAAIRKSRDNFDNFLITEEGFNSQRGNRKWDLYADKWAKDNRKAGVSPQPAAKAASGGFTSKSAPGSGGSKPERSTSRATTTRKNSSPKKEAPKSTTPTRSKAQQEKMDLRRRIQKAKREGRDGDAAALEKTLSSL